MKQVAKFGIADKSSHHWLWQGSANQRTNAFANLRSVLLALFFVWLFFKLPADWEMSMWWLIVPLCFLGVGAVLRSLSTAGISYRIDSDRIEWTTGILSKSRGSVEIFRIREVILSQGLFDRLLNVGTIMVNLHDGQWVRLIGVEAPEELREWLTHHTQAMRRTQGLQEIHLG